MGKSTKERRKNMRKCVEGKRGRGKEKWEKRVKEVRKKDEVWKINTRQGRERKE